MAFLVPVAIYLLVLGWVNRQPRPVIVSGVWDFIGVLFAASGFLFVGGPAVLSSLHERWRLFWLLGEGNPIGDGLDPLRQVWLLLAGLYFLLVVGGSGWLLWRRRCLTCIYNTEPAAVESVLAEVCERLGLAPIRSGNLFVFGLTLEAPRVVASGHEGIQAPHALARDRLAAVSTAVEGEPTPAEELAGQAAILELDRFDAMKHVTLRWDPSDSPLRSVVEAEMGRRLERAGSPYHETGPWLGMTGSALLVLALMVLVVLSLRAIWMR